MTEPRAPGRRPYLDWLRGIGVLIMIEGHALDAWTRADDRSRDGYQWAIMIAGLGAPLFLFLAGVAIPLAAGARLRKGFAPAEVTRMALGRGGWILVLAFLFRLQSLVISGGAFPGALLKVDILNVMGVSMIAAAFLWPLAERHVTRAAIYVAATVAIAMLTPIVRSASWLQPLPDPLEWYLRPSPGSTTFTLFPWAGFLTAGAALGCWLDTLPAGTPWRRSLMPAGTPWRRSLMPAGTPWRRALMPAGTPWRRALRPAGTPSWRALMRSPSAEGVGIAIMTALGLLVAAAGYGASFLPALYANTSFWTSSPTFFAIRLGLVVASMGLGYAATRLWGGWLLQEFGRASLFVYWIHVEMAYGVLSLPLHRRLPFEWALLALVLFAALLFGLVRLKDRLVGRGHLPETAGSDEPRLRPAETRVP